MAAQDIPNQDEVQDQNSPEILYKYLPPERIDILENMALRFGRPSDFNDTFDTHFLVPTSQGSKAIATRLHLRGRAGILCLTERPDDHLMWVHYAHNHTGFVLGFNARAVFFQEDGRILKKVVYLHRPDVVTKPGLDVCFCKSDAWKHEREWRCVREFKQSESREVGIEPSLVRQIIFGSQMKDWQIARIMLYATALEMLTHTQFFRSTPVPKSWSFENTLNDISLCEHCGGDGYLMKKSEP